MILVDVNQIAIGVLASALEHSEEPDVNMIRHSIISRFLDIDFKFSEIYGELVLCYDSNSYWRKDYFPNYKAARKTERAKSSINWSKLFELSNLLREEFDNYLPYKLLCIQNAEADDIIAVLCGYDRTQNDNSLVVSGDKDFKQLQKYSTIHIYNPQTQKVVMTESGEAELYLKEHIIRGDRSDGIPNILSDDNCLVDGIRQKPITKKNISNWCEQEKSEICADSEKMLYNYNRNEKLVDFDCIPPELSKSILNSFFEYTNQYTKEKMFKYFSNCGLSEVSRKFARIFF